MTIIQNEQLSHHLELLNLARASFEETRAKNIQLSGQIETQENAAQAFENEALKVKQKIREALRKCDGRPTKELHDLKSEERSCYSMAEEYRSFADDLRNERTRSEIAACEAAAKHETVLREAITEFSEHYIDAAFATMPRELFVGLMLKAKSEEMKLVHGGTPIWSGNVGVSNADDYVLFTFGSRFKAIYQERKHDHFDFHPIELAEPLNVTGYIRSPLQLSAMKSALKTTSDTGGL